jgi:hypothetical protein
MTKHFLVVATLAILLLVSCGAPSAAPSATPAAPTARPTPTPANVHSVEHQLIFDAAWQTVNDRYFDPTFGAKDWQAIGDEYRQKLATIQDDETFWLQVLNPMLFELGVSHLFALPAEMAGEIDTLTLATGSLGMDVRLLDGVIVITRVAAESPAAKAGLRPGLVITAVDGKTPSEYAAESLDLPPYNERRRRPRTLEYADELQALIEPLNPTLVYLVQGDVASALERSFKDRGTGFRDYVIQFATGLPLAKRRGWQGYEGMVMYWREFVTLTDELFDRHRIRRIKVDNSTGNWDDCNQQVLDCLAIPLVPELRVSPSDAARLVGLYKDRRTGRQRSGAGLCP